MTDPVVRKQSFETTEPVEVTVTTGSGRIDVHLTDEPGIDVEVRHAPDAANPWVDGINSLVSWVSGQLGDQQFGDMPAEAIRQTRIEFAGGRLVVRSAKGAQFRNVPIAVTIRAPRESHVAARSGSATVTVVGDAGRIEIATGAGDVDIERASGVVQATTGTGAVRVGPTPAGLRARTGAGDVTAAAIGGPSTVFTGGGDVWLGAVGGDVMVRTGTGDVTLADTISGQVELTTGSGALRVDIRKGTAAELDVSSGSGEARSELPLSGERPHAAVSLRVRGRTGTGTAVVGLSNR
ncbi:MAG: DUF4097 domain-containing protein [Actinomycetota bacterium]|nr:DUF4097 domain-containing protein [Actinomycetota bacterium]